MQERREGFRQNALSVGFVFRDVHEHCDERVRENRRIFADGLQLALKFIQADPELIRRCVVGRRQPSISQARDPAQAGVRAPTTDPDGRRRFLQRFGFEIDALGGIKPSGESIARPKRP
jgi:hypothetical protein